MILVQKAIMEKGGRLSHEKDKNSMGRNGLDPVQSRDQ
jgi:hypothetical protein